MKYRVLVINPGSTSTKIAAYEGQETFFAKTLRHSVEELLPYKKVCDQYPFREKVILDALAQADVSLSSFNAIIGRGGLIKPIPSGVYKVNALMMEHLEQGFTGEHASNLGGLLAARLAAKISPDCPAFIADPVVVDEMEDVARLTGIPAIKRLSVWHALNQKAVAKNHARTVGIPYEQLNLIGIHLGGGISVAPHCHGRVIDVNNALDDEGPIAPERAGSIPALQLAKLCFSGNYTYDQVRRMLNGGGGMVALLGTNSFMEVSQRVADKDPEATRVYNAMAYSIAKQIGAAAVSLKGKVDGIFFTGGIAHDKDFVNLIISQVSFLGPCFVYPGEDEMGALAQNAQSVLSGQEAAKLYE